MHTYFKCEPVYIWLPGFLFFLFSCGNDRETIKKVVNRDLMHTEHGKGVEIRYSQQGIIRIHAIAPTATRIAREAPYLEFNDGIKILFYSADRQLESTLTSRYAMAYENSRSMTARDSVVVVNQKGEVLYTDELIWDEERKIIYSNSFVKIQTEDEIIYGKGMTANENFTDYVIKNITGKIKVKSSEFE